MAGFPGGSVVKNLPANTAEKQLSVCAPTTEPALSSPGAPTPTEAHEPYSPCPTTRDATVVGGGIGMGKTCKLKDVSFQCMTKFTTN